MSQEIYFKTSPSDVHEEEIRIPFNTDLPYKLFGGVGGDCINCTLDDITPYDWTGHVLTLEVYSNEWSAPDEAPLFSVILDDAYTQTSKGATEGVFDIASKTIDWDTHVTLTPGVEYWYRIKAVDADSVEFTPVRGSFIKEQK